VTPPPIAYVYWAVAGGLVAFGIAGILSIGLPLLLIGLAMVGVGLSKPTLRNRSTLAALIGIAAVAVYVVWVSTTGSATSGVGSSEWTG
jgi:hypothetical protein